MAARALEEMMGRAIRRFVKVGLVTVAATTIGMSVAPSAAAGYSLSYGGAGCHNAYGSYQNCNH
jgi:hypothetical protein